MKSWGQFAEEQPDLAAIGVRLIKQYAVAMAFMATVSKDGGPRLHPLCPALTENGLYVFITETSPRYQDLVRDGRYALHAFLPEEGDEEFYVAGRAIPVADSELRGAVAAAHHYVPADSEKLFELKIERCLHTTWENWATPETRPIHQVWRG